MPEIEDQLRSWADAAIGATDGEPVTADATIERAEVGPAPAGGGAGSRRRLLVAAAVVVLVVGAVGVVMAALDRDDRDQVRAGDPDVATTAPSPTPTEPDDRVEPAGSASDAGELLHAGSLGPPPEGTVWADGGVVLRAASTPSQLEDLWQDVRHLDPTRSSTPPLPEVDLDDRVVVSIAVPGDACPRSFEGFAVETGPDGAGGTVTRLQPELVDADCVGASVGEGVQYVIAVDWASVGDRFALFVDGSDLAADPTAAPDRAGTTAVLSLDRGRPDPVLVDVEPTGSTVTAGSELPATVRVSNNSGEPIEITYCGAEFAVGLESDEVDESLAFGDCLQGSTLQPGTSLFEVRIITTSSWCTSSPAPAGDAIACDPGGGLPRLPAGEYRTRLYPPGGLDDVTAPSVEVTVTDP